MDKKENKKKTKKKRGGEEKEENRAKREKKKRVFCFSLRSTEIRSSVFTGARAKFIYAMKATRGYQNLGVSSNSKR